MENAAERIAIFDLDGTLVDSAPDICMAINHVRCLWDLPVLETAEVRPLIGGGLRTLLVQTGTVVGGKNMEASRNAFVRYYAQHHLDQTQPYPHVQSMLARRTRTAVVTNKPRRFGELVLARFGWSFDTVVYGDDGYGRKPDGAPLLRALRCLDSTPEDAVFIGDTVLDVQAGMAAGIETWLVPWADQQIHHKRLINLEQLDGILSPSETARP